MKSFSDLRQQGLRLTFICSFVTGGRRDGHPLREKSGALFGFSCVEAVVLKADTDAGG